MTDTTKNLREKPIPGPHPGAGHPKRVVLNSVTTPAEVRALLLMVLDADTANRMVLSLRKKIAKGNVGTLEFLFDRLIGRPAVNIHHDADGALAEFMAAWADLAKREQTLPPADDYAGLTIEAGELPVIDAELDDNDESAEEDAETSDIIPIV